MTGKTKKERKIEAITKAATKLFSKKGYRETSMEDIAKLLKMSKGNLYHYFTDKNEILAHILSSFLDLILEDLDEFLFSIPDPDERLKRFIKRHIDIYANYMFEAKILFKDTYNLEAKELKRIKEKERKYYGIVKRLIDEYFGNSLKKEEVTALSFFLLGMCNWSYFWYDPKGQITPQRLSELIYRIFKEGIANLKKNQSFDHKLKRF